jgi:hypothetical protein
MDGMPGVAVAQVILDQPKIVSAIRQGEAAGVAQHVGMDRWQASALRRGRESRVVHNSTEMEIDRQYVDSHRQSMVALAFCRLLGCQLLPRLKAIHSQKLYGPDVGQPDACPHLQAVLTRPADWGLIRRQYDQIPGPRGQYAGVASGPELHDLHQHVNLNGGW